MPPLALDPAETFEIALRSDAGRERPVRFRFRHLTRREYRRLLALLRDASKSHEEEVEQILLAHLAGWEGASDPTGRPIAFHHGALDDLVTESEFWELAWALAAGGRLGTDEKKGCASPSPSASEGSAGPAAAAGA